MKDLLKALKPVETSDGAYRAILTPEQAEQCVKALQAIERLEKALNEYGTIEIGEDRLFNVIDDALKPQ